MRNARAKRAKILFFTVKYANLWGFCCRRRRGCLSSLVSYKVVDNYETARLITAWTTSMLNCWPTKIFQQLIVPETTFHPDRKLIVISSKLLRMQLSYSYLVAESTKCLTHKCWKLPTKSSDEKLKIRLLFFAKHVSVRSVLYLKIISRVDYQQLAGEFPLERLLGLKISGWSVLPIRCYLNYHFASCSFFVVFCQLLPPSIEAGYRSSSFFNLTDPSFFEPDGPALASGSSSFALSSELLLGEGLSS